MLSETADNEYKYGRELCLKAIQEVCPGVKSLSDAQWAKFAKMTGFKTVKNIFQERLIEEDEFMRDEPEAYELPCVTYTRKDEYGHEKMCPKCIVSFGGGMTVLGHGRLGREYTSHNGKLRRTICIALNNGAQYFGIYFENEGGHCQLQKVEEQ